MCSPAGAPLSCPQRGKPAWTAALSWQQNTRDELFPASAVLGPRDKSIGGNISTEWGFFPLQFHSFCQHTYLEQIFNFILTNSPRCFQEEWRVPAAQAPAACCRLVATHCFKHSCSYKPIPLTACWPAPQPFSCPFPRAIFNTRSQIRAFFCPPPEFFQFLSPCRIRSLDSRSVLCWCGGDLAASRNACVMLGGQK